MKSKFIVFLYGEAYDIINLLDKHPGGKMVLLKFENKDATKEFEDFGHSPKTLDKIKNFKVKK